jgi:ribose transport system permease protein
MDLFQVKSAEKEGCVLNMEKEIKTIKNQMPIMHRVKKLRANSYFGPIAALVFVFLLFTIGTGGSFLSVNNMQVILNLASVAAIMATGSTLVILLGCIDLSAEGLLAFTAILCGYLLKNTRTATDLGIAALPIVIGIGACLGIINGVTTTKLRIPSFIATLGMMYTGMGLSIILSGGATIPVRDSVLQNFVNGRIAGIPNLFLIALGVAVIINIILKSTRFGKSVYAVGGDEVLAKQAGINVDRTKIIVFAIAGALYGMAAFFMVARLQAANPQISKGMLFPSITAVVVGGSSMSGGIGNATNAVIGALIVTSLNNGMVLMHINPFVQGAVNGIVLIAAVAATMDRKKIGNIK